MAKALKKAAKKAAPKKAAAKRSTGVARDRALVAGGQDYEVSYVAKKTHRSVKAVKKAVKKVGNARKKVNNAVRGRAVKSSGR